MKKLIVIFILFGSLNCFSQANVGWFNLFRADYFVSDSTGNDANSGIAPWEPWKTLTKLNAEQATMPNNSRIGLKANETWNDTIVIGKATLTFKKYSVGDNPEIMIFYDPNSYAYTSIDINTATISGAMITNEGFFMITNEGDYMIINE